MPDVIIAIPAQTLLYRWHDSESLGVHYVYAYALAFPND